MRIEWVYVDPDDPFNNRVDITVGRRLVAGETFYFNGVRYDMPAIYVTTEQPADKFKYITFQTPLPKCWYPDDEMWETPVTDNWEDWSHVTSQWLANVLDWPGMGFIWFLPPFIDPTFVTCPDYHGWIMVDDIGMIKNDTMWEYEDEWDFEIPEQGLIIDKYQTTYENEFYWTREEQYDPFNCSLAERLYVDEGGEEEWDWWQLYTKPINFTQIRLPPFFEETSDEYDEEDIWQDKHEWYAEYLEYVYGTDNYFCDGNEYLITSSFIAPNCEEDERHNQSKSHIEVHDIVDRASTIANSGDTSRDAYYWQPRVVFHKDSAGLTPGIYVDNTASVFVRVYGEEEAVYPTQSYTGELDFIYPTYVDPFDPGVLAKDSVTFNPAFIDLEYIEIDRMNTGAMYEKYCVDRTIRVNGGDASEKVFLRLFYEPWYWHPVDSLMDEYSDVMLRDLEAFNAIVVETTYFLTDALRNPIAGAPPGQYTHFVLPYTTYTWDRPGMTIAGMLDLSMADGRGTSQLTDGMIDVEKTYYDVPVWNMTNLAELNFLDHNISITDIAADKTVRVLVKYVGNMFEAHAEPQTHHNMEDGVTYWFSRHNSWQLSTTPTYRWYMRIEWVYVDPDDPFNNRVDITVGRRLAAGETFYFNGVRYDMPAIYVTTEQPADKFKYITFQTPLPKCEPPSEYWETPVTDNWEDWTHVTSQWLANVLRYDNGPYPFIWFLPPFIDPTFIMCPEYSGWTMVDDIGMIRNNTMWEYEDEWDIEIPEQGLIIDKEMMSLEYQVYWEEEYPFDPFNTSLAERLYVCELGEEEWDWWNVYTKPINYTLIHLPDLETFSDVYLTEDIEEDKHEWYADFLMYLQGNYEVDGYEYFVTTSWIAPNCEEDERHEQSKSFWDVHDIIGRGLEPTEPPSDWNPWDDDQVVTLSEVQEAIAAWILGQITLNQIQTVIFQWIFGV
jgi:hypothetical protein